MPELRRTPISEGTSLELVEGTEVVSSVTVVDLQMRIGRTSVRCGGIGGVGTPPEHRMKGYSRRLLENAVQFMTQEGYHVSALFGIPSYYHRFGYAPALVGSEFSMATRDMECAHSNCVSREFEPADAPRIVSLYNQLNEARTGTIVRDPQSWKQFKRGANWTSRVAAFVVLKDDVVVGYASYNLDPWRFGIAEVGCLDGAARDAVLARVAQMAIDMRLERVTFHVPHDDVFARHCHKYGCRFQIDYSSRGNGMARIINQSNLMALLQTELDRRVPAGFAGSLVWETELGRSVSRFGSGTETVLRMPATSLAQLVLGYRDIVRIACEPEAAIPDTALPVVGALFPEGCPFIWLDDRF